MLGEMAALAVTAVFVRTVVPAAEAAVVTTRAAPGDQAVLVATVGTVVPVVEEVVDPVPASDESHQSCTFFQGTVARPALLGSVALAARTQLVL